MTLGRRLSSTCARIPGANGMQRRWWAWQERRRLHERFPVGFKIVSFFLAWIVATVLLLTAYALLQLAE